MQVETAKSLGKCIVSTMDSLPGILAAGCPTQRLPRAAILPVQSFQRRGLKCGSEDKAETGSKDGVWSVRYAMQKEDGDAA